MHFAKSPLSLFSTFFALLAATATTNAHPLSSSTSQASSSSSSTAKWSLSLYQNTECSGEATPYSGNSSLACNDGILNGGALGYIVEMEKSSNCTVLLYSDERCRGNEKIASVNAKQVHKEGKCLGLKGNEDKEVEIMGVRVVC